MSHILRFQRDVDEMGGGRGKRTSCVGLLREAPGADPVCRVLLGVNYSFTISAKSAKFVRTKVSCVPSPYPSLSR